MNKFIQIRGGNASGKTTIIRKLIEEFGPTVDTLLPAKSKKERVKYSYIPKLNLYILGSYRVVFGGLDSVDSKESTFEMVNELLPKGNIICEGVRASGSVSPWDEFLRPKLAEADVHMVLLDTTPEVMIQAAIDRTGRTEPFTDEQIKIRHAMYRSLKKQSNTWKEFDSRYNVIYSDRDSCYNYVRQLAEEMLNANPENR